MLPRERMRSSTGEPPLREASPRASEDDFEPPDVEQAATKKQRAIVKH
jgi:hypothetical protein